MARRDRTTGLPRPRGASQVKVQPRFSMNEQSQLRFVWIAGGVLIAIILAALAWRWYDNNYRIPEKTILTVGEERFKLNYYADRLLLAAQSSGGNANLTILEQTLLTNLEDEALAEILARERGITVTDDEITNEIASQLGVPVGGPGTSFDTLYRQRLATVRMSDSAYRRYTEAQVFIDKLGDAIEEEIGTTDDMVTIRRVVSATKEDADAVLARVKGGENFGSVAQAVSTDPTSRQNDGLDSPEPPLLLPENVRNTIGDKPAGDEIFGPIEVNGSFWVFKIENREPEGAITETQKGQLADIKRADAIKAKRSQVEIDRNMSSKDFDWANEHAGD
jgi:hypothetical protein